MRVKLTVSMLILFLGAAFLYIVHGMTHPVYHDKDYVQAIVGEASDQTEDTMICVAHALRNRGTINGVYGYHAEHVWTENDWTWHKAWVAWELSGKEKEDPTHGAKHFGTITDLENMEDTPDILNQCGDFYFY